MKVLATTDTLGGVWTYSMELARALVDEGVEVALATQGAVPSAVQRAEAAQVPGLQLHESAYRLEWMPEPWEEVARCSEWLLKLAARFRPDVVHLNDYSHAALPWGAPVVVVGHSCVLSWWEAVRGSPLPGEWARYAAEVTRGLQAAQVVVAPSRAMGGALQRHYGPLPDLRVILNGARSERRPSLPKEELVLAAGRLWDEAKNIASLQAAAPRLPWPVILAGDTRSPRGEEALPSPGCRQLGRLERSALSSWLERAAIYALPARYEPFGLSVLEAAQAGCALVLGDIESLRELWEGAALFVPPDDQEALVSAVTALSRSPSLRQELAARALGRAQVFTPSRMASQYAALYRELVGRGRSGEEANACTS